MRLEFPSPIGELHFSIRLCERRNEREKIIVSVPYRGATFLNFCISTNYRSYPGFRPLSGSYISQFFDTGFIAIITPPFPSPIGELHFSITKRELINITDKRFPSPIGELHFSILPPDEPDPPGVVSVPYRGATFLN